MRVICLCNQQPNCVSCQCVSGRQQQMVQSQSFPWPVWFHFLLVLLALGLTAHLLPFRHNTMAIGIAVDILGCTGSLEDRAATLNKIIQVAVELKDSMGDLYSFSAIMKALEMPQVYFHLLCAALWACVYLTLCKVVFKSMPGKPQVTLVNSKGKSCLSESCFD